MTDNNDDFKLIPSKFHSKYDADEVVMAVYKSARQGCQLNVKLGFAIRDRLSISAGDKIEFRYSIGKRQIMLKKGPAGFTLRDDGSFRRTISRGRHQEPFPEKAMSSLSMEVVSMDAECVILQLPEDIHYD